AVDDDGLRRVGDLGGRAFHGVDVLQVVLERGAVAAQYDSLWIERAGRGRRGGTGGRGARGRGLLAFLARSERQERGRQGRWDDAMREHRHLRREVSGCASMYGARSTACQTGDGNGSD